MEPDALDGAPVAGWIAAIAQQRDRRAFAALFEYYAPKVKAYMLRQGMADPTADELAQQVLKTIWDCAEGFDPSHVSPSAWIFSISRDLWIDHTRSFPD